MAARQLVIFMINLFYLAPNFAPYNISIIRLLDASSVEIGWTTPSLKPDADGYVVYYASDGGANQVLSLKGGNVRQHTLKGLAQNTKYTVSIRAYQDLLGPASEPLDIYTSGLQAHI